MLGLLVWTFANIYFINLDQHQILGFIDVTSCHEPSISVTGHTWAKHSCLGLVNQVLVSQVTHEPNTVVSVLWTKY